MRQTFGTFATVIAIVMSLMVLEQLLRMIEFTRLSGHRGTIITQTTAGLIHVQTKQTFAAGSGRLFLARYDGVRRVA